MEPSLISPHNTLSFPCHSRVEIIVAAHTLSPQPEDEACALRGRKHEMLWIPWRVPSCLARRRSSREF